MSALRRPYDPADEYAILSESVLAELREVADMVQRADKRAAEEKKAAQPRLVRPERTRIR